VRGATYLLRGSLAHPAPPMQQAVRRIGEVPDPCAPVERLRSRHSIRRSSCSAWGGSRARRAAFVWNPEGAVRALPHCVPCGPWRRGVRHGSAKSDRSAAGQGFERGVPGVSVEAGVRVPW